MNTVTTSTTTQIGRELLVEALNNFYQYKLIQAFIEKYWTWQKNFEEELDRIDKDKPSHAFYCPNKRCLVIGGDRLKEIYPNFELSILKDEVNAKETLKRNFQILLLEPDLPLLQTCSIINKHFQLLRQDLIDNMQTVFANKEHRSAVKEFLEYKVNKIKPSRIKFINKLYCKKILNLENKEERLSVKRDFVMIGR